MDFKFLKALKLITLIHIISIWYAPAHAAIAISDNDVNEVLRRLDIELAQSDRYMSKRLALTDSLHEIYARQPDVHATSAMLARAYISFNNDSALTFYSRSIELAFAQGDTATANVYRLERMALLPLGGFISEALSEFNSFNPKELPDSLLPLYYDSGRQMYSYLSSFYPAFKNFQDMYHSKAMECQALLLTSIPESSHRHQLNLGEHHYHKNEHSIAKAILKRLIEQLPEDDNLYARATHIIADIALAENAMNDYTYYITLSAISDVKCATLEITSLQELGQLMMKKNDVKRAHTYLYSALKNAVECHAESRMLQVSETLPLIESLHQSELDASRRRIYLVMIVMALTVIALIFVLASLRKQAHKQELLQNHLEETNRIKEAYISQFLNLCSIYMDKLNQFCKIANRKISTGNVDDLYKMTRSGKFIEDQSHEFYQVFDNAFLHIYPNFVEKVNALLREECRITPTDNERLNTDLRILAFMRLGIDESARIAQILNYSVYTIYTYRHKLKTRAINRDTFEADIMSID